MVKDQYGDVMDSSDYIAKWSFKTPDVEPFTTPSTDKLVSLDIYTGKVTVSPCAKEWKNVVMEVKLYSKSGAYISKINSNNVYRGLQIVRKAQPSVTELDVTTEELTYPLSSASTRSTTLTADAETEYGEKGAVTSDDNVQWILEEVAYKDGSTVSRLQAVIDPETGNQKVDGDGELMWSQTGQITTDSSTGSIVYTDASRKTISLNRTTGVLTFANGVTNMSWAPISVTLTCMYSNASVKVTVPIKYNGAALNDEVREPTTMKIPTSLSSVITVPASDEPDQTVELDAQVSDQFGFIIRSESGTNVVSNWEITEGMTGVSLNGTIVSVNSMQRTAQ